MHFCNILSLVAIGLAGLASAASDTGCDPSKPLCPEDMHCISKSPECEDTNQCVGTCEFKNTYPSCGGRTSTPHECDDGYECQDDPRTPEVCGLKCDGFGICLEKDPPSCGGFAGFQCPEGLYCYDLPGDGCDPNNGGADCIGVCL